MRRLSGILCLVVLLAPVGLRLAMAGEDTAAMRCAIACGHAPGMMKGASCCLIQDDPGSGPALKTCPLGGDAEVAPVAHGQPALLPAAPCLAAPMPRGFLGPVLKTESLSVKPLPPDHVPLLFG